jgi:hypothetical protein
MTLLMSVTYGPGLQYFSPVEYCLAFQLFLMSFLWMDHLLRAGICTVVMMD